MAQLFLIIRTQLHVTSYALLYKLSNLSENTHMHVSYKSFNYS